MMPWMGTDVKRWPLQGGGEMRDDQQSGAAAYTLLFVALAVFAAVLSTGPFLTVPGDGERACLRDCRP